MIAKTFYYLVQLCKERKKILYYFRNMTYSIFVGPLTPSAAVDVNRCHNNKTSIVLFARVT